MSVEPKLPPCPHCGGEAERFGCHGAGCEKCGCYSSSSRWWRHYVHLYNRVPTSRDVDGNLVYEQRKETDGGQ